MSLPVPTTSPSVPSMNPKQLQAMEAPLIALTQQCKGDLRQLMFAFFSFLNRRTDFYLVPHPDDAGKIPMGFQEGDAEKMLLAAFRQFPLRRIPKGGIPGTKQAPATKPAPAIEKTKPKKTPPRETPPKSTKAEEEAPPNMKGVRHNEEGLQIPVGNGGSTPRYKWTQTIDETTVLIGVPKSLRGKDYDVQITSSALSVKAKKALEGDASPITFVQGELVDAIRMDESTWSVEGGVMTVTLDKKAKKFWTAVYADDVEKYKIDTELVDSRRRIEEYDDATQAQFRKTIFDQNQYHLGGPTSDEILGIQKPKGGGIPGLPQGVEYVDSNSRDAKTNELPPGVEYIDKKTLDEADNEK